MTHEKNLPAAAATTGGTQLAIATMVAAAWLSSGFEPWRAAVAGAMAPSDFATDFVPASHLGGRMLSTRAFAHLDVAAGNAEAVSLGAPPYMNVGVPFGAHPPPAVLLVAALVPLGFANAALVWQLLSMAGLAVVAWVAVDAAFIGYARRRRLARVAVAFALFAIWPPVLHNVEKGQWSLLLAGLLAGAWWMFSRRRDGWTGALIGIAAAFKVMPLLVLMAFLGAPPPRRRRLFLTAGATLVSAVAVSGAVLGPGAWIDFVRAAPVNTRGWQTGPANTLSLWGALARFLVGGPFARPISASEAVRTPIALTVWAVVAGVLLVAGTRLSLRTSPATKSASASSSSPAASEISQAPASSLADGHAFAFWCTLAVVLSPLAWTHSAATLLLPLALLMGRGADLNRPSSCHQISRIRLGVVAAALTIPRATLSMCAGASPVSPARGLVLAVHLAAALILVALSFRSPRPAD